MNRLVLILVVCLAGLVSSCVNESEKDFYDKLEKLKSDYSNAEIKINKRKFNEDTDPLTTLYLYTNADRDNLADEVRFWEGHTYRLSYDQIPSYEYRNNPLDKNIMVRVESTSENHTESSGWISLEHIEEFRSLAPYLK